MLEGDACLGDRSTTQVTSLRPEGWGEIIKDWVFLRKKENYHLN